MNLFCHRPYHSKIVLPPAPSQNFYHPTTQKLSCHLPSKNYLTTYHQNFLLLYLLEHFCHPLAIFFKPIPIKIFCHPTPRIFLPPYLKESLCPKIFCHHSTPKCSEFNHFNFMCVQENIKNTRNIPKI